MRNVPDALVHQYVSEGWWTDDTLGDMVAEGLGAMPDATFAVHSAVRPWRGSVADLDRDARRFAGWLRDNDIGPGDIVAFQLPNWVEAAVTFWGAAYAGAVVVPIVHFYGTNELEYILRVTEPALVVTADRFGHADYPSSTRNYWVTSEPPGPSWAHPTQTGSRRMPLPFSGSWIRNRSTSPWRRP